MHFLSLKLSRIDFINTSLLLFFIKFSFQLNANFTQLSSGPQVAVIVLVCAMASLGKFIGAGIPAYLAGSTVREAATVASLMYASNPTFFELLTN